MKFKRGTKMIEIIESNTGVKVVQEKITNVINKRPIKALLVALAIGFALGYWVG